MDDFEKNKKHLRTKTLDTPKKLTLATTFSAADVIKKVAEELNGINNLECEVVVLRNNFFGENVIVAGLITGQDLINQLKGKDIETLVLPSIMLRPFTNDFLDNITISDVENALGCKVKVVQDIYSTKELFQFVN